MNVIDKIEKEQCKSEIPQFNVGDTVKVATKIVEGSSERIQNFVGVVIAKRGSGIRANFTVRRVSMGYGVEKIFPIHSPLVDKVTVERKGSVRRAKLFYLREKVGKAAKVKE